MTIAQYLLLLVLVNCLYAESTPHYTVSVIPATLGQDIQLRCSKIVQHKSWGEVNSVNSQCTNNRCHHAWLKNGNLIDVDDGKYKNESVITNGYCENFQGTQEMIKTIDYIENFIDPSENRYDHMICLTSILTIKSVDTDDLDTYSCNLTYHGAELYWPYLDESDIQNINLINAADITPEVMPPKIDYFQSEVREYSMKNSFLTQCVVTGMDLVWKIEVSSCSQPDTCSLKYSGPLEQSDSAEFWRCFNFKTATNRPLEGITESVAFFSNVCNMDNARLYCSQDASTGIGVNFNHWRSYRPSIEMELNVATFVIIPVVGSFFIFSLLYAIRRSGYCGPTSSSVLVRMVRPSELEGNTVP